MAAAEAAAPCDGGGRAPLVSLVTPARDAGRHLAECAASVVAQTHAGPIEWLLFDDGSTDDTRAVLEAWRPALEARGVRLHIGGTPPGSAARGCGFGRNRAVEAASPDSALLVFLDADDVMAPRRVEALLAASAAHAGGAHVLLGSRYWREGGARPRDAAWHNGMSAAQLHTQRLRETTLAQPTWALTHAAFAAAGGYNEEGPNNAEDLQLFYAHLAAGGVLHRVDEPLVMHTADGVCATRGVPQALIWALRVAQLELVLAQSPWREGFTIWNAGKEGRALYKSLSAPARAAVRCFADVDARKLAHGAFDDVPGRRRIPVVHFREAPLPLLLCVKLGLTGEGPGSFEANLASLNLREGVDYLHFS